MTDVPDTPRASPVRGFIIFGISGLILLLVGSGIFYRYLAHRWWPDFVVRTTPFSSHLWDVMGVTADKFPWERVEHSPRIQADFIAFFSRLLESGDSFDHWKNPIYICMNSKIITEHPAEKLALFTKICGELTSRERWRRGRAAILISYWHQGEPKYLADWSQLFLTSLEIMAEPSSAGAPWHYERREPVDAAALYCNDPRILPLILATSPRPMDEYIMSRIVNRLMDTRISPAVRLSDIAHVLKNMDCQPDKLAVACAEMLASKGEYIEACLDLAFKHLELLEATMKGLLMLRTPARYSVISHRWPHLATLARTHLANPDIVGALTETLIESGDVNYLPWMWQEAHEADPQRRTRGISGVGYLGSVADAQLLLSSLDDPENHTTVAWAIRRLDDGTTCNALIAALFQTQDPISQLDQIFSIAHDDPVDALIAAYAAHRVERGSPLYQALTAALMTAIQRAALEAAVVDPGNPIEP